MISDIEKTSLAAHVEICSGRYGHLEKQLTNLEGRVGNIESRVSSIEDHVVDIKETIETSTRNQSAQLIKIGTTITGVLITTIIGLLVHLATK